MKFISAIAIGGLFAALPALAQPGEEQWGDPEDLKGREAPTFELKTVAGEVVNLAELKGRHVILEFWASWCPWCRNAVAKFEEAEKKFGDNNVQFYIVAVGQTEEAVETYLQETRIEADILIDSDREVSDAYWVDYIPHVVIVDPSGKVIEVAVGQDKVAEVLDDKLPKLLESDAKSEDDEREIAADPPEELKGALNRSAGAGGKAPALDANVEGTSNQPDTGQGTEAMPADPESAQEAGDSGAAVAPAVPTGQNGGADGVSAGPSGNPATGGSKAYGVGSDASNPGAGTGGGFTGPAANTGPSGTAGTSGGGAGGSVGAGGGAGGTSGAGGAGAAGGGAAF